MSETASWQPSAPIANLLKRAAIGGNPAFLCRSRRTGSGYACHEPATITDIHGAIPDALRRTGAADGRDLWLMTSPEYHMKRLMAAGSPIYQMGRCFRNEGRAPP